jgi:hypothetical protein
MSAATRNPPFDEVKSEPSRCIFNHAHLQHRAGRLGIEQDRQSPNTRRNLTQQLDALGGGVGPLQRQAGDVASRPRQAGNDAILDWVRLNREDDRHGRCRPFGLEDRTGAVGNDDIDFAADELGEHLGVTIRAPLAPLEVDRDCAALDPAELAQSLHEGGCPLALQRRSRRAQKPDRQHLARLLRAQGQRPRRRRAAEQRDKVAAFQLIELHPLPLVRVTA